MLVTPCNYCIFLCWIPP